MEAKQGLVCPIVRRFKTVQINLFLSNESGGFCGGTYMDTKALQPHKCFAAALVHSSALLNSSVSFSKARVCWGSFTIDSIQITGLFNPHLSKQSLSSHKIHNK